MVSSINGNESSIQSLMFEMFQKMNVADTDGTAGLSKDELSSIDAGSDVGGSAFLKSLTEQFDSLDADGNGQLSAEEISSAKPPEPMGPPPGMNLDSEATSDLMDSLLDSLRESLDKDESGGISYQELSASESATSSNFVEALLNNFGGLDKDSNGELSQEEMKQALNQTVQDTAKSASNASAKMSEFGKDLGNLATSFLDKLISHYKNGNGLSELASSFSSVI